MARQLRKRWLRLPFRAKPRRRNCAAVWRNPRRVRRQALDLLAAKTGEADRLMAEAAAAASAADLGDEAAAEIRSAREAAWSAHRAALDRGAADVFEAAMRRDDAAGATRVAGARELAALRERKIKLAGVEAERERAKADLEVADKSIRALDHEIATIAPAAPPRGRDPLAFIDAWRIKRNEALALVEALRRAEDAERRAEDEGERMRERLSAALSAAGVADDEASGLEALIEAAETALGERGETRDPAAEGGGASRRGRSRRGQAQKCKGSRRQLAERPGARHAPGRGLARPEGEPALGAVKQSLKALDELRATLNVCAELEDRIAKMERDKRAVRR